MKKTSQIKEQLRGIKPVPSQELLKEGLSTGSTLINLACSGRPSVGFLKGHYYFLVGDSQSGKTFLSLTCLAEAVQNPVYKDYRFIFDNVEAGALMDIKRYFGEEVYERLEAPSKRGSSRTLEEFYYHLDNSFEANQPFIYILDSMDSLDSEPDIKKFRQQKRAHFKTLRAKDTDGEEEKVAGSYGVSKAKLNSSNMRMAHNKLVESGSILIVISQTRDNIATFSFEKNTRAGGRALTFYATLELWSSVKEKLYRSVRGKNRQVGAILKVRVKKNRISGRDRTIEIPFYYSFGLDDLGGLINFLVEEKEWEVVSGGKGKMDLERMRIVAKEFTGDKEWKRKDLIAMIEEEKREGDVKQIVCGVWDDIEKVCAGDRRSKYARPLVK